MYILAKLAQAAGLTIIGVGFVMRFPTLIHPKVFAVGAILFVFGWIIERYLLK